MLEVRNCGADAVFRLFTACQGDATTLILDVRPYKDDTKQHIVHSFCVRTSANGAALLDYSKSSYDTAWSDACWWNRHCILYGAPGLKKDHPVAQFLARDGHALSVSVCKDGFDALAARYPFLTTAGVRTQRDREYPSLLGEDEAPYLYLGNWGHAEARDRLAELSVRSVLTIHNNPERLALPPGTQHMQIQMADVDTEDIAPWMLPAHEFIEAARAAGHAVLVHCGAGVSRSAALCIAHLMRRHSWTAARALDHVKTRRSIVQPNDGFWHALCTLEAAIGVADRSNPEKFRGVHGRDAAEVVGSGGGERAAAKAAFIPEGAQKEEPSGGEERLPRRSRSRSRSQSRDRARRRDDRRSRSRSRGRRDASPPRQAAPPSTSLPTLDVLKDGARIGTLVLEVATPAEAAVFGRLPSCSVVLDHLSISRQHAKITMDASGALFVTDLGSAHGTCVDGAWLRAQVPRRLAVGTAVRFGASSREYRVASLPSTAPGT